MHAGQTQVSASLEDYLEAIFHTVDTKGAARAKDIVQRMGVNNSSVTQALRLLSEKELVNYTPYDVITLTDSGEKIALDVVRQARGDAALPDPGAGPGRRTTPTRAPAAWSMPSAVPVLERLVQFVDYFETCPLERRALERRVRLLLRTGQGGGRPGVCARGLSAQS